MCTEIAVHPVPVLSGELNAVTVKNHRSNSTFLYQNQVLSHSFSPCSHSTVLADYVDLPGTQSEPAIILVERPGLGKVCLWGFSIEPRTHRAPSDIGNTVVSAKDVFEHDLLIQTVLELLMGN